MLGDQSRRVFLGTTVSCVMKRARFIEKRLTKDRIAHLMVAGLYSDPSQRRSSRGLKILRSFDHAGRLIVAVVVRPATQNIVIFRTNAGRARRRSYALRLLRRFPTDSRSFWFCLIWLSRRRLISSRSRLRSASIGLEMDSCGIWPPPKWCPPTLPKWLWRFERPLF